MTRRTYIAHAATWHSAECRMVAAGEQFEADFPDHMRLGPNLQLVEIKPDGSPGKPAARKAKPADSDHPLA